MNARMFKVAIISTFVVLAAIACSPLSGTPTPTSTTPATVVTTPAATTSATATATQTTSSPSLGVCGTYQNHLYEACVAYVWNDAHWSLQPYYKYVHSDSLFRSLKDRLALKYHDQALQIIQQRATNWPLGTNTVDGPDITILTARSSLECNKAVLTTREDWTVRDSNDKVLYQENGQAHTVVLHRIPDERFEFDGHVLHQWTVYAIYDGEQNLSVC